MSYRITRPQDKRLDATHNFLKYDEHGYLYWPPKIQTESTNKTKAKKNFGYTTETMSVVKKTHEGMRIRTTGKDVESGDSREKRGWEKQ
ncbi:hypothetical protein BOTCAL_0302g00100 [Botryotinia calthae]|uniref:Uncharacterized protein n=1 Tax=Botryotinia calthae TaxID=38488 RepID=A0A4Y8CX56_9HELO|nr:hypothetical protein BOTCAL_0302g00100 [Botryotinia calthae]